MSLPSTPSLQLGGGVQVLNPTPLDVYEGPYASVAAANAAVPSALRSISGTTGLLAGRTVIIDNGTIRQAYWWDGGILDSNLIIKVAPLIANTPATNITPVVAGDGYQTVVDKLQSQATSALANAGNPLQAETIVYINKIKAKSNTYIDAATVQAIDRFFSTGKADGWLTQMKWVWCPMSSSFAGSLVNLYNAAGVPNEIINNNFVSTDYNTLSGFGTGVNFNANKYIDLGFTPASVGITNTNIALGEFIPDDSAGNFPGFMFAVNTSAGGGFPPAFYFRSDGNTFARSGGSGGASNISNKSPTILIGSFPSGTSFIGYNNGNIAVNSNYTISATVPLDANPTLFYTSGYTSHYANGKIGFAFISLSLTAAMSKSLSDAIRSLMIQIGRLNNQGGIALFAGDSITNGSGASNGFNRWASIVATGSSLRELNFGVGSSRLNSNVLQGDGDNGVVALINRYLDLETISVNTVFVMIGTNDVGVDGTTSGDPTLLNTFTTNYTTILNYWLSKRYNVVSVGLIYSTNSTALLRSAYQNATFNAASALNIPYVDCETLFSDKPSPSSLLVDGTHPNDAGHRLIANAVTNVYKGRLSRNPLVTFGAILTTASADLTFNVIGVTIGSSISLGLTTLTNGLLYQAFVSATNVVTIRCINNTVGTITPPSQYMLITAIKTN